MELVKGSQFLEFVRPDVLSVERLRPVLAQLATGLVALHRAGMLHRDLKPSNVIVTPEGRPVILDFGIAADMASSGDPLRTAEDGIWGTAEYMSPEQGRGEATAASDWYAVGCMLYEALTGRLPFAGSALKLLLDKAQQDPPDPSKLKRGLPADLVALCRDLMARSPERRPKDEAILTRLGVASPASGRVVTAGSPSLGSALLIGRAAQLAELERAFGFARVPKLLTRPAPTHDVVDPVALRRKRFSALQGLFRRIVAIQPVVVHIDDLQWGDADSIMLLDSLLGPPEPPALLVIASLSSEDPDAPPPFLRTLLDRTGTES